MIQPEQASGRALIFVPAWYALDGEYAMQCYQHCRRRRYGVVAILRDWSSVEALLRQHTAAVVVMAPTNGDGPTERLVTRIVGEVPLPPKTRDLGRWGRRIRVSLNHGHHDDMAFFDRAQVAEVLDGDGPIPAGLDPDAIAAARRIARHLTQRNDPRV